MVTLKDLIKKGDISASALQVLSYIADNKGISTSRLRKLTSLPKTTLYNHVLFLRNEGYIIIDTETKSFTYSLSEKGLCLWTEE